MYAIVKRIDLTDRLGHAALESDRYGHPKKNCPTRLNVQVRCNCRGRNEELEDLPCDEIAEILNCSIGTVISRRFYARKKLQTLLTDLYANPLKKSSLPGSIEP
jgi:hypothetical protein